MNVNLTNAVRMFYGKSSNEKGGSLVLDTYKIPIWQANKDNRGGNYCLEMPKSSHKAFVLGDMNDVCGSLSIRVLETSGLKDT